MCGQFGRYKPTAISASGIDLNEERSHLFVFFPFQLMSFYCSVIGFVAVFESFEGLWIWVQIFKVFEMSLNFVGKGEQSLYLKSLNTRVLTIFSRRAKSDGYLYMLETIN